MGWKQTLGAVLPRSLRPRKSGPSRRAELLRLLPTEATCVEVGVWKGDFSAEILEATRPEKLHLVDPWQFAEALPDSLYGGQVARSQKDMDRIYGDVRRRFAAEIDAGVVAVHRAASAEAAKQFPDDYFDWVYIDGDHSYEAVRDDLAEYHRALKPNGILAGDDYVVGGWWGDGVQRAVKEFVDEGACTLEGIYGSQFVLRKVARTPTT